MVREFKAPVPVPTAGMGWISQQDEERLADFVCDPLQDDFDDHCVAGRWAAAWAMWHSAAEHFLKLRTHGAGGPPGATGRGQAPSLRQVPLVTRVHPAGGDEEDTWVKRQLALRRRTLELVAKHRRLRPDGGRLSLRHPDVVDLRGNILEDWKALRRTRPPLVDPEDRVKKK